MATQHRKWQETVESAFGPSRPLEEHLRRMQEDMLSPSREAVRRMEEALRPNRQLEEQLRRMQENMLSPSREAVRRMEEVLRPNRQLEEQLRRMQEDMLSPSREAVRRMEEVLRPKRQLEEHLPHLQASRIDFESLAAPTRQLMALFEKQHKEFQQLRGVFASQQLSTSLSALNTTLQQLVNQNASALRTGDLSIGPDGEVFVGGEVTSPEEIAVGLSRLTEALAPASTLPDYFRRLLEFFGSLKQPLAAALLHVLLSYLISVAANLTTPMLQNYWDHFVGTSRKEAVLAIQGAAKSKYDETHLEGYRFVTATRLRVHSGYEGQDDIIAEIAFGKVVRILESKGRRTLVEFLDDARNESHLGWVASRYLAVFSK